MPVDAAYPLELHLGGTDQTERSAGLVVPILLELFQPRSVVDVGCGTGIWLSMFQKHGVADVHGVDGPYNSVESLRIDKSRFSPVDLEKPFSLERLFDCAVSLEVAEHVSAAHADQFVECLTRLAPVVVFSAAIPFQGGFGHINEQWPDYWAERFGRYGYLPVDAIRRRIWHEKNVCWYTKQNTLLFVRGAELDRYPKLRAEYEATRDLPLSLVHPDYYLRAADDSNRSLREVLALVPRSIKAAGRRWWGRLRGTPDWHKVGVSPVWDPPKRNEAACR